MPTTMDRENVTWFKFYTDYINNIKTMGLPAEVFRTWISLLCIVAEIDADGTLPGPREIEFRARLSPATREEHIIALIAARLIDHEGQALKIHSWSEYQPPRSPAVRMAASRAKLTTTPPPDPDAVPPGNEPPTAAPAPAGPRPRKPKGLSKDERIAIVARNLAAVNSEDNL